MPNEQMSSANKPLSAEGRTYHVETRHGEVANRIVTVGDPQRARTMAKFMDKVLFEHTSHRGFLTITGLYKGLPLSIVAIGMGLSMMDFFVRETRMVVEGPLSIVRFGSCGSICDAQTGDVIVAKSAFGISRNFDYFNDPRDTHVSQDPYILWKPVASDDTLTKHVAQAIAKSIGEEHVFEGSVGNADSFYGSQGRLGTDFCDDNEQLLETIHKRYLDAAALEMESHMLFHLAQVSTGNKGDLPRSIKAACALVVFADRTGNSFITPEKSKEAIEVNAKALFDALVADLPSQDGLHPAAGSVWENELA
ncbi:purine and uridine phosphorylase [Martensiomyces pterosporus]|nr:purine and uridine phosphorylase [Martensiomyces pterosporus]